MIIDCHGRRTPAPPAPQAWRTRRLASPTGPSAAPAPADLRGGDEPRETVEPDRPRLTDGPGIDTTVSSPRASFTAHHVGAPRPDALDALDAPDALLKRQGR
ncbi:hypothetical protein [Streptomyces sp. NPDC003247]|uniref:hypothetical protein n=1 Tax=Streptomyces sp. NPDC003247 TaxID=3364677 RepID=UPI0036822492